MADSKLAAEIGTDYAKMLHKIIPKIEEALKRGEKKASFTVTAKFNVGLQGGVDVMLTQTASIPLESSEFKLTFNSGQLNLFEPA